MPDLKQLARRIFHETLAAIDIPAVFRRKLDRAGSTISCGDERIDLAQFSAIRVVAIGKASLAMTRGLTDVLAPDFAPEGIVVSPAIAPTAVPSGIRAIVAGHPLPNEASFEAARAILDLLARCDEKTAVFFLLSGGGSALVELPLDPNITLADTQELHRVLVYVRRFDRRDQRRAKTFVSREGRQTRGCGAARVETHVWSERRARGSRIVACVRADAAGSHDDCRCPRRRCALRDWSANCPRAFARNLRPDGALDETPKPGDSAFRRSQFALLLGMDDLFHPAHRNAEAAGCVTFCDNSTDDWPVARAADYLLALLDRQRLANPGRPVAVIADGELSSPVTGDGVGGRNSAFVLECVPRIAGKKIAVLSAGTDGVDGSSPAAGAVADGETLARAPAAGLDPADFARHSDSFTFFNALGDAVVTGPTGNNLRDLRILIAE